MKLSTFVLSLWIPFLSICQEGRSDVEISRIAFGSCSKQEKTEKQLWREVREEKPDLWIWLGDNIYSDTEDMEKMRADYALQKSHRDYQKLLRKTRVIGIWDDHDYGVNDGGTEYPKKDESRDLLFEFVDLNKTHPAWKRKGAYQAHVFNSGDKKIKVILLDARYFRDPFERDENRAALPNPTGNMLGEKQWSWLEDQLQDATIDLFILGSGIQFIAKDHKYEKWANFPKERQRMMATLKNCNTPVLFLSGDRHISEVSKTSVTDYQHELYDITSSSLTNPWKEPGPEVNTYRIGEIVYPVNFAVLDIQWKEELPVIKLKYVGNNNETLNEYSWEY